MRRNLAVRCLAVAFLLALLSGCVGEEQRANSPLGNFEALWKIIDERYCFLDYKQVDWQDVYRRYRPYITEDMASENLFEVLANMLAELRDGHVNLYSSGNAARYWNWYQDYPRNYSEALVENYLGRDYRIGGGMRYTILDDNIGYVSYPSFSQGVGDGNLNEMLRYMEICNGLIIDVRHNGGGEKTNANRIAGRFTNERTLVGYISHKTGKGHSDFSQPTPIYIEPSKGVRWQKPVVVLMNRRSYSATNDFVSYMGCMPHVTLMGDCSGGGSGMPFSSELPNGWGVRFSACPSFDAGMRPIEFGVEPHIYVSMDEDDEHRGVDTLIEAARVYLAGEAGKRP